MRPTAKTKVKKSVDSNMSGDIKTSSKRAFNTWILTRAIQAGKVYELTESKYVIEGTKKDAIGMLATIGNVSTARDILDDVSTICGYRTVDAFRVYVGSEEFYFFAERI